MINNDFAFNTIGLVLEQHRDHARSRPTSPAISSGRTTTRPTLATASPSSRRTPNKVTLQNNLFYGNGASDTIAVQRHQQPGQRIQPGPAGNDRRGRREQPGQLRRQPGLRLPDRPQARLGWSRELLHRRRLPVDLGFGGDRQRLGSHGDPDRLPGQLSGQDPGGGFGSGRLRPTRHRGLRVRRHRRPADRRLRSGSSPPRWCPSPAQIYAAGATVHRHHRRPRRSPSPSRAMSIPRTSRRPTWSFPARPSTRRSPSRHQPDLDRRAHRRIQPGGPVQLVGHARRLDRRRRDPEHDRATAIVGYSDNVGLEHRAITPPVDPTPTATPTRADRNRNDHRRRHDHSPAPSAGTGTQRPAPQEEGPRRAPREEAGQARRRHQARRPSPSTVERQAQGRAQDVEHKSRAQGGPRSKRRSRPEHESAVDIARATGGSRQEAARFVSQRTQPRPTGATKTPDRWPGSDDRIWTSRVGSRRRHSPSTTIRGLSRDRLPLTSSCDSDRSIRSRERLSFR